MFLTKLTVVFTVTFCAATGQFESPSTKKFLSNSTESLSSLSSVQSVKGDSLNQFQNVSLEPTLTVFNGDQTFENNQNNDSSEGPTKPLEDKDVNENQNTTSHDTHRTDLRRMQQVQTISSRRNGSKRLGSNASKRELPESNNTLSRRPEQRVSWPHDQRTTVQSPRVHQRKPEIRRLIQRKSEYNPLIDHHERPRLIEVSGHNDSREVNAFAQLDSVRFQQSHQQRSYAGNQKSQPRFSASIRTPVFDVARISSSRNPESPNGNIQSRHFGRDRYLPSAEPTDLIPSVLPATSDIDESRTTKPISFDLGFRRRIRYHRPIHNKTLRTQGIPYQGEIRTRPLVRYIRPNYSSRQQNLSESNNSDLLLKSGNDSDSDWIPKPGPHLISDTPASPVTPLASTQSLGKTISNITLSLQHARELFARAQESYKALSSQNSSYVGNSTTHSKSATEEPEGQYSSSYTKIRQTDGSITRPVILSSSTRPPSSTVSPTKEISLTFAVNSSNNLVSENHSTEIHSTTSKPIEEISANKTSEHNITVVSSSDITSLSDNVTSPLDNTTSVPNNVTLESSTVGPSTDDSITPYFTTLSPPVFKNTQFDLSQFSNLQNFTPFGLGRPSQQQNIANLFQSPISSSPSGSASQPLGLSSLFGLGNIPSLGSSLGTLGGFGVGQRFGNLNAGTNPADQSGSTGLDLGYLGLLSGLSGLGLGQIGGSSSAPELSLPSIHQDSSGPNTNTGLGFLSGLPSLSLNGLGSLSSLGSLGSLPGLGGIGSNTGSPPSGLSGLTGTGLSGLGLTGSGGGSGIGGLPGFGIPGSTLSGLSGSGSSTSNLGTILGKLSPTDKLAPVIGQSSGASLSVEGTLVAAKTPGAVSVSSSDTAGIDTLTK